MLAACLPPANEKAPWWGSRVSSRGHTARQAATAFVTFLRARRLAADTKPIFRAEGVSVKSGIVSRARRRRRFLTARSDRLSRSQWAERRARHSHNLVSCSQLHGGPAAGQKVTPMLPPTRCKESVSVRAAAGSKTGPRQLFDGTTGWVEAGRRAQRVSNSNTQWGLNVKANVVIFM